MPFAFIPFSEREPAYQRFEDDRLTQRDIGLSAIFTVRQAIMNQIRAHDRQTQTMTSQRWRRWTITNFFSEVLSKPQWSQCFNIYKNTCGKCSTNHMKCGTGVIAHCLPDHTYDAATTVDWIIILVKVAELFYESNSWDLQKMLGKYIKFNSTLSHRI